MMTLLALFRFFAFVLLCVVVVPIQSLVLAFTRGDKAYIMPRFWHQAACLIFGIKLSIEGSEHTQNNYQKIYMGNHLSYLDIPAIGSVLGQSSFVAKSEVASWPVFGFLSKLQQTAFINRKRTAILAEKNAISQRVAGGRNLIIFPEGTSTDGQNVRDFKPSLFALALDGDNAEISVQPMTLVVEKSGGKTPKTQQDRDLYAWHIDMDMPLHIHLWRFAKSSGAELRLTFHPPLLAREYQDRKVLAKDCYDSVVLGLSNKQK